MVYCNVFRRISVEGYIGQLLTTFQRYRITARRGSVSHSNPYIGEIVKALRLKELEVRGPIYNPFAESWLFSDEVHSLVSWIQCPEYMCLCLETIDSRPYRWPTGRASPEARSTPLSIRRFEIYGKSGTVSRADGQLPQGLCSYFEHLQIALRIFNTKER